ncbi:MAG: hypothetical protein D6702_00855 [Planctomycetota bacterium]|nr:MAG: hypothetical protein D6702_00855 [Planctomycetota bacterium]
MILALLLFAGAPGPAVQEPAAEEPTPAAAMLAAAEELAAQGKYRAAWNKYRNLIRRYRNSPEAAIAARRAGGANGFLGWADLRRSGPSANRVDVVVMGDGYTLDKQDSLDRYARYVPDIFARHEVFGEYIGYFNFLRANVFSAESGIDGYGRDFDTALGAANVNRRSGGHVSVDRAKVMAVLDELPEHDHLAIVFVRGTAPGTGGGGVATIPGRPEGDMLIHEWGHAFAGLADEYSDDVGYTGDPGTSVNVSNDPSPERVPWRHWLEAGVKGVGVYLGAAGRARGAWKPTVRGCAMQNGRSFCVVCREALVLRIYSLVDPIDDCSPPAQPLVLPAGAQPLTASAPLEFRLTVLEPESHRLQVAWWVLPPEEAPPPPRPLGGTFAAGDRRRRGPLAPIPAEPAARTRPGRGGVHRFRLDPDRPPGLYRVVARAWDDTRLPGERHPWVLKDEYGLLESERAWWVRID